MIYSHNVKHNGVWYRPGEDVPMESKGTQATATPKVQAPVEKPQPKNRKKAEE